ncbi:hypothetical protein ACVIU7_006627 [Bradyrhizobium liaoningense]
MKGIAGISRPRRRCPSGKQRNAGFPCLPSGGITPPSVGRPRAVRSPQLHRPPFSCFDTVPLGLHAVAARAMFREG